MGRLDKPPKCYEGAGFDVLRPEWMFLSCPNFCWRVAGRTAQSHPYCSFPLQFPLNLKKPYIPYILYRLPAISSIF